MIDDRDEDRKRKRTILASAWIGVLSLIGVLVFFALHPAKQRPHPDKPPAAQLPIKERRLVSSPPTLNRADLLAAARLAASNYAAQGDLGERPSLLKRRFAVRIAFGCYEDGNNGGQTSVAFNPDYRSVTLSATPVDLTGSLLVEGSQWKDSVEAVEAFWLPRAWTDAEACPPQVNYIQPALPTPPTSQSVGLVQAFSADGARQTRREKKPYLFTRKLAPDDTETRSHHYFLTVEGEIVGFPDGKDIHCWMERADHRPVCIFGTRFDIVAFEDAVSGEVLAKWTF